MTELSETSLLEAFERFWAPREAGTLRPVVLRVHPSKVRPLRRFIARMETRASYARGRTLARHIHRAGRS